MTNFDRNTFSSNNKIPKSLLIYFLESYTILTGDRTNICPVQVLYQILYRENAMKWLGKSGPPKYHWYLIS